MAVTAVPTRVHRSDGTADTEQFCSMALSGTYATGGFTWPVQFSTATKGSSPIAGTPLMAVFCSPLGYIYVTTFAASVGQAPPVATTKILTAANTELANTTAVPEATVPFILFTRKINS